MEAIDRILRYLEKTPRKGILMKKNNSNDICGYTDTDWVRSLDRKSATDYYTFVWRNIVT
jgi:hypothetical protein